jgi:hypothetical protein
MSFFDTLPSPTATLDTGHADAAHLIHAWLFNAGSGTAVKDHVTGVDGTLSGTYSWAAGGGVTFGGGKMTPGSSPAQAAPYTIVAGIRPTSTSDGDHTIFGWSVIFMRESVLLLTYGCTATIYSNGSTPASHVSAGTPVQAGFHVATGAALQSTAVVGIDSWNQFFNGEIAFVYVYAGESDTAALLASLASDPYAMFVAAETNEAPVADAGSDQSITSSLPATATLAGSATDDGLPDPPAALSYLWTVVSSPGGSTVTFTDDSDPGTDVELSDVGEYVLRLTADDGDLTDSDDVTITVTEPHGIRVTRAAARSLSGMESVGVAVSRVVVRTLSPMPSPAAVTRLSARSLSGMDSAALDVSRLAVRVLSRQLPPDPCAAPPDGEDLTTATTGPLLFSTYDPLGTGALQAYDEVGAPDDLTYHGGRKWPWLMSLGPVRRALSDHKGNYEVGRFDISFADPERRLRQLLATAPGKYTPSREVAAYLVSDAGRRAKVVPHLVAWGLVEGSPKYNADLSVGLSCRDVIGGGNRGWGLDGEALIPKRLIASPEFPEARPEVRALGVPFPLGILSDAAAIAGAAPIITGNVDKDRGYMTSMETSGSVSGDWCGFGDMAGPAPPTNVTCTDVPDSGAEMGTDAHSALRFYVMVTSVGADGVEGDPEPFYDGVEIVLAASTSILRVSWTASGGAAKYRAYCGWVWYGVGYVQYIETAGTTCDFTRSPTSVPELVITSSMITPGAFLSEWGWGGWYAVSALMPGGIETPLSDGRVSGGETDNRWGVSKGPVRRPVRLEWEAVTGAEGYRVKRGGSYGPLTMSFDVPSTQCWFDDDHSDSGGVAIVPPTPPHGAMQPIYVGDVMVGGETWRELLVAGCAIKDITHWHYDNGTDPIETDAGDGTDYLIPSTAPWAARFTTDYIDVVGSDGVTRRRTVIYARGAKGDAIAAGTATFRIDLEGVEDVGNGSGEVLTDLYDQAIWFFEQLVLQSYLTGDWTCPPVFPGTSICQINRPSFRAVGTQRKAEIAGGYVGAWVVGVEGERVSAQQWIQRICQSGQFRIGPNRFWQIKAWAIDANLVTTTLPHVHEPISVDKESGDPVPHPDHLANVLPYTFGPPLDAGTDWLGTATLKDAASIAAYGQEYPGDTLSLYCLRSQALAAHAAGQALLYSRLIPHTIEPVGDLKLTALDLGDAFLYDHYRGLGSDGYSERPFVVIGWTFLSAQRQIQLECLDLGDMLSS